MKISAHSALDGSFHISDLMLRLALVGPLPPPEGGMANQCLQLARLLGSESVSVELVRTNAPYRPAWLGRMRFIRAPLRLIPYICSLWRAIGQVDLVHLFANSGWAWHLIATPAMTISRMRGKPIIVNYRGGGAEAFLERAPKFVRRSLARADCLVVPSGYLKSVFARFGIEARIIPNIIDLERFHPGAAREPSVWPHIVVTRNLEAIYDVATAIRALALLRIRIPNAHLTVAGSGPERAALETLAASLGIASAVRFAGRLDNAAIAELYRTADAMLNPSRVDNMPISVLEAFASGVRVVSTDVGGVPFIAQHERNALLVPPADPAACAEALERVLTDSALAERVVSTARDDVAAYSWDRVRNLWLGEYRRFARSRGD